MLQKMYLLMSVLIIFSHAITVDEILDKMEQNDETQTSKIIATQTSHSADGKTNISKIESYSMDKGDKGISIYTSPARIKGMKMLMLNDGDDIWFYSPRTSRVRKIASHQKNQSVNGSDFSYEDMSTKDRREDYDCKIVGEDKLDGADCYKIEMIAKSKDQIYQRILFWVDKEKFIGKEGHFFDEEGALWKKLYLKNFEKIGKYWTPKHMEMQNVQKGSKTIFAVENIEFDIPVDESMFSERYLRK